MIHNNIDICENQDKSNIHPSFFKDVSSNGKPNVVKSINGNPHAAKSSNGKPNVVKSVNGKPNVVKVLHLISITPHYITKYGCLYSISCKKHQHRFNRLKTQIKYR